MRGAAPKGRVIPENTPEANRLRIAEAQAEEALKEKSLAQQREIQSLARFRALLREQREKTPGFAIDEK
jgi:hypothetical protein